LSRKTFAVKINEMGCMDGVEIKLLNKAPLGTPYYFLMGNTRIALGKEIVNELDVQLVNDDDTKKEA
jgi:Fe2+ transport system protein FeoA